MCNRKFTLITALVLCVSLLTACASTADVLDDQVNLLASQYSDYIPPSAGDMSSVLDTLDMMLDQYVSGLQKPAIGDIQQTTVGQDQSDLFQTMDGDFKTIDDMKACILQAMTDTRQDVSFYIDAGIYSNDVLYDVIFNQLCEEYMIETMGVQQYSVTTMAADGNKTAVEVRFSYFRDQYTLDKVKEMKDQTLAKAKQIVRDLDLANKSTADAIYAVNQYLCDNCIYPATEPYSCESHSPYGALIEQSAVCEGYARAAQLIFSLCSIDSYYVVGDTPQGGHAWNLVKVDGQYYQLDVTWNDVDSQPNMYYLVTDDYMSLSRTWDRQKYPVSAITPYK